MGLERRCGRRKKVFPEETEQMKKIPFVILVFFLAGCTTGPTLYPNAHLQSVGEAQAQKDIADCEVLADQYVKSDAGIAVAKSTAIGGAGGAVVGGAVGAVTGSLGRGVGVGAAAGAATGLVHGIVQASDPSPIFKNFMTKCLQERGYEVIGWE
jgi:outer membrane lipoprotein SlyB